MLMMLRWKGVDVGLLLTHPMIAVLDYGRFECVFAVLRKES